MIVKVGKQGLINLLCKQIENTFNFSSQEKLDLQLAVSKSLQRTENCFQENTDKYYWNDNNELIFNAYHSGQYSIFLYFTSQEVYFYGNRSLADKIYYLNRMLNSCDLFYEVNLPDIFYLDHPLGSIMGRASYNNFLVFQQGCTIGGNHGIYPRIGEFVYLYANATIIGNSNIGNNVFISAGSIVKDEDIPDNTIVFGKSPNLVLKHKPPDYFYRMSPFRKHKDFITSNEQ